jgi:hypothetical protein
MPTNEGIRGSRATRRGETLTWPARYWRGHPNRIDAAELLPPSVLALRFHSVGSVVAEPDRVATPNHLVIPGGVRVKVIGERGKQMDRHVIEGRATTDKFTHPYGTRANVETIIYPASACPDVLRLSVAKLAAGVLFAAWEVAEWPVSHGNVTVWEEPRISAYIASRVVDFDHGMGRTRCLASRSAEAAVCGRTLRRDGMHRRDVVVVMPDRPV